MKDRPGGYSMTAGSCSTFRRAAFASLITGGLTLGHSTAVAHADITPITLGNGIISTVGGCLFPDLPAIIWCTQQEVLTQHAPLMLDLNPVGTAIVVLGAGLYDDGTIRPVLRERLDAALTLAQRYPSSQIITSGGVPRSGITEARAMSTWLIANDIAPWRITEENASRSTVENARNTAAILAERGAQGVVIVSSPNHVERALIDFRKAISGRFPVSGVVSAG
ncbi:YdcF family protein [Rhodococcus sovatensis]|uniref:YdcF family protein n=1 Tax=Rhodococcus sovatensis TaxID=1805840 RepID=A0ABZ2PQ19_9NOCA